MSSARENTRPHDRQVVAQEHLVRHQVQYGEMGSDPRQLVRQIDIVGVQQTDKVAIGGPHTGAEGGRLPAVVLQQGLEPGVGCELRVNIA